MRRWTAAVLVVAVAGPATAARDQKSQPAQVRRPAVLQLKAPKDVRPEKAGPGRVRAPLADDDGARDAAADQKRDELIAQLLEILPKIPDENEKKAELIFQLAEAYWEKSRTVAAGEARLYDEQFSAWLIEVEKKGAKGAGPEPKLLTPKADVVRRLALGQYQTLLAKFPGYPRKDEVLFVIGYNLYESGQKSEGLASYNTLIKQYPDSRFVPDAYVQMGEHYFSVNDLPRATAAYSRAAEAQQPKIYAFALYKLAWCDYNGQDYAGAIEKFQAVIDYAERQAAADGVARDRIQLKNEALKDLVLAFAQVDAIAGAIAYFKEKTEARAVDYVNRLAASYFEAGKFRPAIQVYQWLEQESPAHVRAPAWQQKILLAFDKLNDRESVVAQMKVLVERFGPRSPWAAANADQKGALAEATELAESAMRELVSDYHQEAIRTKSVATYQLARDIYRKYLDTFPDQEAAYPLRFYYAEILYALEEWEAAGTAYAEVVSIAPQGQFAQAAAYDTILALEKQAAIASGQRARTQLAEGARIDEKKAKGLVEQKRQIRIDQVRRDTQEEPIPELEQRLIAACERYLTIAPKAKDEIVIRYKAAFTYYDHRHYVEAAKRFGEIILKWPTDSWSQKAAELSMDILEVKEQWQPLSDLAQRFREDRRIAPPGSEFSKKLARIGEGARFKYAQDLFENRKEYELAAREFQAFVEAYPRSEYAALALNNGVLIAERLGWPEQVVASAGQLLRDFPKADEAIQKPAQRSLALGLQRSARYVEAAQAFLTYADRWPQDEAAADALFNAALLRERLGDDPGALALWLRYARAYAGRPETPKVAFNVGLILQRQKEWRKAADLWSSFQREQRGAPPGQLLLARYNEALALRELRADDRNVPAILAEVAGRFASLPEPERVAPVVNAAAHARWLRAEPVFADFAGLHFNYSRQQDLVYVLKLKTARMARLRGLYTEVIQVGSPLWSQAALCRLGEAAANFNRRLLDAPTPRGLTPEQEDLYRSTLENQALPLEDEASEAFEKAVETASRTATYSEWTLRAQEQLKGFKPDAYGELRRPAPIGAEPFVAVAPPSGAPPGEAGGAAAAGGAR